MTLTFFKAYYTEEFLLIDDRKTIAYNYLTGWFFLDFVAILPLYLFLGSTDYSSLARLVRILKLPRSLRIIREFSGFNTKNK